MKQSAFLFALCLLWGGPLWLQGPSVSHCCEQESSELGEKSQAAAADEDRLRAERLFGEGENLRSAFEKEAGRNAVEKYQAALELWRRLGDMAGAARASQRIGLVHEQTGALNKALQSYQEALGLSRDSEDRGLEGQIQSDFGLAHVLVGNGERALEQCEAAFGLSLQVGSVRGQAKALNCLGEVDYHRGNLNDALGSHHRAELLWRTLSDRGGQAQTMLFLGSTYSDLSELDKASAHYQEALSGWEAVGNKHGQALTQVALGRLQHRLGAYQPALNAFNEAMPLVEAVGDVVWQASIHAGIAAVYRDMGERQNALGYWTRALELFGIAGIRVAEADVLLSLGAVHITSEDYPSALACFRQSLEISKELSNQRLTSTALRYLGSVYQSSGEPRKALEYYQRSLSIQRPGEYLRFRARTLGDMGLAYVELGADVRALDCFNQALTLSRTTKDRVGEATGLYNLALATRGRNDLVASRQYIEECLRIAESLRMSVASHKLRASYVASIHRYHDFHIELLMRLHQAHPDQGFAALALEASERGRARSLLESLVEGGVDIRRGIEPQLLEREQHLRRTMDAKADRLMRLMSVEAKREEAAILEAEVQDLAARFDQLQAEVRSKSPRFAALTQPQPLSLEVIQRQMLDEETLILEYALGEERSFLWAVAQHSFTSHELPPGVDIERMARQLYELMTARQPLPLETVRDHRTRVKEADSQYLEKAAQLSETLLGPVAEQLDIKRLLIVSDGALQYLPFGALPVPHATQAGEELVPMVAEYEVVSLPSASMLAVLRRETGARESPAKTVAVLADPVFEPDDPRVGGKAPGSDNIVEEALSVTPQAPPLGSDLRRALRDGGFMREGVRSIPRLPATRQEAQAIIAAAPAETSFVAVDFQANREMAMSADLGSYRIVHFATHGLLNSEHPELSGIFLSMVDEQGQPQNGFLRLPVIYNLELPVDLVVLSACNSALGKEVRGEGLVGMVRGFMYAGAARVIASLWKVDDEATGQLMRRFYHGMLKQGLAPSAALRQAQIAMWKQKQWRSPFYWAAFVLQGEWT